MGVVSRMAPWAAATLLALGTSVDVVQAADTTTSAEPVERSTFSISFSSDRHVAEGTLEDCYWYLELAKGVGRSEEDASCWKMADRYKVSPADLVDWNPSLKQDPSEAEVGDAAASYDYPCKLSEGLSYCIIRDWPEDDEEDLEDDDDEDDEDDGEDVGEGEDEDEGRASEPPSPRAEGEIEGCTFWYKPYEWDNMEGSLWKSGLTCAEFYAMNPSVGPDCFAMKAGIWYCRSTAAGASSISMWPLATVESMLSAGPSTVTGENGVGTPRPYHLGMTSDCVRFHQIGAEDAGDDGSRIAERYGIELSDFYAWNLNIYPDKPLLKRNNHYCVGVDEIASATASTTDAEATTDIASMSSDVGSLTGGPTTSSDVDAETTGDGVPEQTAESAGTALTPSLSFRPGECATMGFALYALQWVLGRC